MNNFISLLAFVMFCTCVNAQSRVLVSHDLNTGEMDSITNVEIPELTSDKTNFFVGDFNQSIAELPDELDESNLFGQSQWTNKKAADLDYDISDFPIRTSVKLFRVFQDSLLDICSGSIVGSKYVLSAGHCIADNQSNIIFSDIVICPVYNNGMMNELFECHKAEKVHLFKDWKVGDEDFGIYELDGSIGEKTGWISIGFDEEASYREDILHKFSYPIYSIYDSLQYNGDTLYHSFGYADIFQQTDIGISYGKAMPGESGSSIIHVDEDIYTSYGVSTYSGSMLHARIEKQHFYPIRELLTRDGLSSAKNEIIDLNWKIYPNPSSSFIQFSGDLFFKENAQIEIYNWGGKLLSSNKLTQQDRIDVSNLVDGSYILRIQSGEVEKTFKFIKGG